VFDFRLAMLQMRGSFFEKTKYWGGSDSQGEKNAIAFYFLWKANFSVCLVS
jgi:hypothetical protein